MGEELFPDVTVESPSDLAALMMLPEMADEDHDNLDRDALLREIALLKRELENALDSVGMMETILEEAD